MAEEKWIDNKFKKEEEEDTELFIGFISLPILLNYGMLTAATVYGTICDFVMQNITGGTNVVETKKRHPKFLKEDDCFIEPSKYDNLMKLYKKGCLPWYLNFIGDKYYLWIIPSVPKDRIKLHKDVVISSGINENGKKTADRYGLKWEDAFIFDRSGKICQKPECFIKPQQPRHHNIDFKKKINNKILNDLK